jgi:replication-associated recombination protein RarA
MFAESYRPTDLGGVYGHHDIKQELERYLKSDFKGSIFLSGPPGIGKTTLALCSAKTFGFYPLEINASSSIRSFEDVDKLKDSCRGSVNIHSLLIGNTKQKTCVILDELDGSDPHAQNKIVDWIKDPLRTVPILCTGNETPSIIKRNSIIKVLRCFPPNSKDIEKLFPKHDVQHLLRECQHDVRRIFHRIQYGQSYSIQKYILPPTGTQIEIAFTETQKMFEIPDPLEYLYDILGNEHWLQTKHECNSDDKRDHNLEADIHQKKLNPDKSNKIAEKKK